MVTQPVNSVRALLLTPSEKLLVIRRVRPGVPVYWVLPGGGIEQDDKDLESAVRREVLEETGGHAELHRLVHISELPNRRQAIFLGRIDDWAEERRTGPEFTDPEPDRGTYTLEELVLDPDDLAGRTIWPVTTIAFLIEQLRVGTDLFALPDLRDSEELYWSVRAPRERAVP